MHILENIHAQGHCGACGILGILTEWDANHHCCHRCYASHQTNKH